SLPTLSQAHRPLVVCLAGGCLLQPTSPRNPAICCGTERLYTGDRWAHACLSPAFLHGTERNAKGSAIQHQIDFASDVAGSGQPLRDWSGAAPAGRTVGDGAGGEPRTEIAGAQSARNKPTGRETRLS